MYRDNKMENYLSNIKNNNITNKLANYKKATKRLEELNSQYQHLCQLLQQNPNTKASKSVSKSKSKNKSSLQDIIVELDELENQLDQSQPDMVNVIQIYLDKKKLLDNLASEIGNDKNELYQVNNKCNKIEIAKLESFV